MAATPNSWLTERRRHLRTRVLLVLNANLYCVQSYEAFVKCWSLFSHLSLWVPGRPKY
jgi:hypothetical protein